MLAVGILVATVASFAVSAALYALPPVARLVTTSSTPRAGIPVAVQMAAVVARSLVISCLVAALMLAAQWSGPAAGVALGAALAVVPLVLLSGAVIHEGTPLLLAATHLTDWVLKLIVIGALVGLFI